MLISFDGIDSSGKATQVRRLAERLRHHGKVVRELATPDYTTPSGQELKKWLQGKNGNWQALAWEEKMKLFAENRAEKRDKLVEALSKGEVIVYDRYVPSSLAFITVEATLPQEADLRRNHVHQVIESLEYETNRMPREDVSIFLDVPPRVAEGLLEKRKHVLRAADEYTDHVHVMERLYNEYDVMCQQEPNRYLRVKATSGNELLGVDDVSELVWEALTIRFPLLK